jgi:hypothetical protein
MVRVPGHSSHDRANAVTTSGGTQKFGHHRHKKVMRRNPEFDI